MRLSPLLCVVSVGKNGIVKAEDHVKVVKLLLLYGARPDAKDVVGKTVCHYGAGAMATDMTIEVVRMCSAAAESSHLFGKEVVLQGLNKASLNGKRGIAHGFVTESGRRVIYLIDQEKELSIKPENITLGDGSAVESPTKLCDIQDRLGGTALLEVFLSDRVDVGKFLIEELGASVDIRDSDGCSAKSLALNGGHMFSAIGPVVMKAASKRARQEDNILKNRCSNCDIQEAPETTLLQCSKW